MRGKGNTKFIYAFRTYSPGTYSVPDTPLNSRENQTPLKSYPPGRPVLTLPREIDIDKTKYMMWADVILATEGFKQGAMGAYCLKKFILRMRIRAIL